MVDLELRIPLGAGRAHSAKLILADSDFAL